MEPVDLVATQLSEVEQRREDAWALMKKMHDQANGIFEMTASGGWCAPSSAVYSQVNAMGVQVISLSEVQTTRGGIRFS